MNAVLVLLVICAACWGLCAWQSPDLLRSIAAKLLVRADVIEAARRTHEDRMFHWKTMLHLDTEPKLAPGAYKVEFEKGARNE